jgi:hypothetical protein
MVALDKGPSGRAELRRIHDELEALPETSVRRYLERLTEYFPDGE